MTFRNETAAAATVTTTKRNRARVALLGGVIAALPVAGLVTATTASAAPVSTWEKVAQCESSGNWSINTGNGFYGGVQFTSSTWAAYGGHQYAPQANQATEAQQISVAEKVLASQGPGAWPVCSIKAGLTKGGAAASVNTSTPAPAKAAKPTVSHAVTALPKNAAPVAHVVAATPKPVKTVPMAVKTMPMAVKTAPKPVKTTPAPAPVTAPTSAKHRTGGTYTVKSGDSLSGIAAATGVDWHTLYQLNHTMVGGNPNLILPGQVLTV